MNKDEMIKEIEKEQPIAMMIQRYLDNNNIKVSNPLLPMHIEEMLNRKNYHKVADDEIVVKKREYENKEIASFLRGRESAFCDIECMYNVPKKDIDYIKTIGKAKQETARAILKELNDEGYKIYKQQGNTFDAGNFNWLIAYTMRKYGIELEEEK